MSKGQRKGWARRAVAVLGYAAFFATAFAFFLWRELPYPEIARALENRAVSRGIRIAVQGLGPGRFPGIRADRVRLRLPWGDDTWLDLVEVAARADPLSWLGGHPAVVAEARMLDGTAWIRLFGRDRIGIEARWSGWNLARMPLPEDMAELGLAGEIEGNLEWADVTAGPLRARGKLYVRVRGLKIGPGKMRGIRVPEIVLGEGGVALRVAKGRVKVEDAKLEGGDVALSLSNGSVALRKPLSRSLVNGILSVAPSDNVRRELALLFALFPGGPGSDGRYTARVRGTLGNPRLVRR